MLAFRAGLNSRIFFKLDLLMKDSMNKLSKVVEKVVSSIALEVILNSAIKAEPLVLKS